MLSQRRCHPFSKGPVTGAAKPGTSPVASLLLAGVRGRWLQGLPMVPPQVGCDITHTHALLLEFSLSSLF